jgi:hypothetical protein
MIIEEKNELCENDKRNVMDLWNKEYPASLYYHTLSDFDKYLTELKHQKHFLVKNDGHLLGWAFKFTRENENWFAIIVDTAHHKNGIGKNLTSILKRNIGSLSGWVIDNDKMLKITQQPYLSPLNFYIKNGFQILPDKRLKNEKISAVKIQWNRKQ